MQTLSQKLITKHQWLDKDAYGNSIQSRRARVDERLYIYLHKH